MVKNKTEAEEINDSQTGNRDNVNFILNYPVALADSRVPKGGMNGTGQRCCCCCCCCCDGKSSTTGLSVVLNASADMIANPGDASTPAGVLILGIYVEFSWVANGGQGVVVDIQAQTLDRAQNPAPPFQKWTNIIANQRPVGVASWKMERQVVGNTIRFQAVARDQAGNEAYSNVVSYSPGK